MRVNLELAAHAHLPARFSKGSGLFATLKLLLKRTFSFILTHRSHHTMYNLVKTVFFQTCFVETPSVAVFSTLSSEIRSIICYCNPVLIN